jgi:hypothetical protein
VTRPLGQKQTDPDPNPIFGPTMQVGFVVFFSYSWRKIISNLFLQQKSPSSSTLNWKSEFLSAELKTSWEIECPLKRFGF